MSTYMRLLGWLSDDSRRRYKILPRVGQLVRVRLKDEKGRWHLGQGYGLDLAYSRALDSVGAKMVSPVKRVVPPCGPFR